MHCTERMPHKEAGDLDVGTWKWSGYCNVLGSCVSIKDEDYSLPQSKFVCEYTCGLDTCQSLGSVFSLPWWENMT